MSLSLDDCSHCACVTPLSGYTRESAVAALESGELGCWNCSEDTENLKHFQCVALFENGEVAWDGRHGARP